MEIDDGLIAELPDLLILDILDRLGLKEVAHTAALTLCCDGKEMDEIRSFVAMVPAVLALCRGGGIPLESLSLCFYYENFFASDVDSWLAKIEVENLTLALKRDYSRRDYPLPTYSVSRILYSNSSLTELRLECCFMAPMRVDWRCLTNLSLVFVQLPQQVIEEIVAGCPVLETLDLDSCTGFERLEIGARSFRRLQVRFVAGELLLEISAPYMRHLQIEVQPLLCGRKLRLRDGTCLESARVDISAMNWKFSIFEEMMPNAMELFQDLRHVKKLDLSGECTKIVSLMATNGWQFPQWEVEDLQMEAEDDEHSIYGVIALLESSPHLESLHISSCRPLPIKIKWGSTTRDDLTCDLIRLKTVDLGSYYKSKVFIKLAHMLVKRAPFMKLTLGDYLKYWI